MHGTTVARLCSSAARASGVERLPGATQKYVTPSRTSSSTARRAHVLLALGRATKAAFVLISSPSSASALYLSAASSAAATSAHTPLAGVRASSMELHLRSSSAHSASGHAPRTMPTPAYTITCAPPRPLSAPALLSKSASPLLVPPCARSVLFAVLAPLSGRTSAERIATENSAPSPPSHPNGPAYMPLSKGSASRMARVARSVGWPHIAGVGCSLCSKCASDTSSRRRPWSTPYKCWIDACLRGSLPTTSSTLLQTSLSSLRTSSLTIMNSSCSFLPPMSSRVSAASSSSVTPRARVAATASLATSRPTRR
mmetsp:Transcript_5681/g.22427  ORF Transcript_5681/g.22427 Transcript_5681/m.22427 type:complete len:313 (+) Transcript_5681:410-1348(+)